MERDLAREAIERLKRVDNQAGLAEEIARATSAYGLDNFTISGLPDGDDVREHVLIAGWPEWSERYQAACHYRRDPVVRSLRQTSELLLWRAAPADAEGASVMAEAADYGLRDGLSIPIFNLSGFQSAVSFSAQHPLDLPREHLLSLHLVGIFAHTQAVLLTRRADQPSGDALTPRETECLKWAAAGKSAWDTSVILGLANKTVEHHLDRAIRKLGAVNKVQAVANALRRGYIN